MKTNYVCVGKVVDEFGEFYICREINTTIPTYYPDKKPGEFTGQEIELPKKTMWVASFRTNQQNYLVYKKKD